MAFADTFHSDRGNAAWASADNASKQAALVKATDYLDQTFSFLGERATEAQALEFPRDYGDGKQPLPAKLKQATAVLALEALTKDLNPSLSPEGQIKRKKADVLEKEYFEVKRTVTIRPKIEGLLSGLIPPRSGNARVVRA
ncbi:hypothetical protein MOR12E_28880 [Methylobacterium oryzae]